jgi:hypothetical protein
MAESKLDPLTSEVKKVVDSKFYVKLTVEKFGSLARIVYQSEESEVPEDIIFCNYLSLCFHEHLSDIEKKWKELKQGSVVNITGYLIPNEEEVYDRLSIISVRESCSNYKMTKILKSETQVFVLRKQSNTADILDCLQGSDEKFQEMSVNCKISFPKKEDQMLWDELKNYEQIAVVGKIHSSICYGGEIEVFKFVPEFNIERINQLSYEISISSKEIKLSVRKFNKFAKVIEKLDANPDLILCKYLELEFSGFKSDEEKKWEELKEGDYLDITGKLDRNKYGIYDSFLVSSCKEEKAYLKDEIFESTKYLQLAVRKRYINAEILDVVSGSCDKKLEGMIGVSFENERDLKSWNNLKESEQVLIEVSKITKTCSDLAKVVSLIPLELIHDKYKVEMYGIKSNGLFLVEGDRSTIFPVCYQLHFRRNIKLKRIWDQLKNDTKVVIELSNWSGKSNAVAHTIRTTKE